MNEIPLIEYLDLTRLPVFSEMSHYNSMNSYLDRLSTPAEPGNTEPPLIEYLAAPELPGYGAFSTASAVRGADDAALARPYDER